jgi:hypothetical protein
MSGWSKSIGQNQWSGGGGMRALTEAEALEWMEQHDAAADAIQAHFPSLVEEA